MEIERKWMVQGEPAGLSCTQVYKMEQGYISVRPTVRLRREALDGGKTALVLCFKGAPTADGLSREEIETEIEPAMFARLEALIGKPMIEKLRKVYPLPDGLTLEVNWVDVGSPNAFAYAEVEFDSEEEAKSWQPESCGLGGYLADEVTGQPGSSMGDYWIATRGNPAEN